MAANENVLHSFNRTLFHEANIQLSSG